MSVRPDIQSIDEDQTPLVYDLIIGPEIYANWKLLNSMIK